MLKVLDFYKCYRAYVRGKVDSFQLDDPNIPPKRNQKFWKELENISTWPINTPTAFEFSP